MISLFPFHDFGNDRRFLFDRDRKERKILLQHEALDVKIFAGTVGVVQMSKMVQMGGKASVLINIW
jgi:hypothetical protein